MFLQSKMSMRLGCNIVQDLRKGKEMAAVRFAYYLNSERYYKSLSESIYEEWSGFMRSFKVKQSQRITVNLEL